MRQIFALAGLSCLLLLPCDSQTASSTRTAGKAAAQKKAIAQKSTARKSTATSRGSVSRTGAGHSATLRRNGKRAPSHTATWRTGQMAPTPARYREIQQALAAKGYLKPEQATGTWNQESIDALKRFQAEQKIEPTGKINSLSLIALGLGPKHESAAVTPPANAQPIPDRPAKSEMPVR
ncbi:MAG TPA: peptidoglycan-binding domain-containing protein [Bryobacteraceae bacterium]|jgi:hypothetical protein|nr:peptidoglycan-binding domain-containing protein [Bryobacteraceae bacterium]